MSTIRPGIPSVPLPPQPAARPPVPAARSDFFRAALEAAQAGGPQPATRTAAPPPATPEERPTRPGALLDIRV